MPDYPDVKIEVIVDNGLTDIAAEGYDAGIRLGDQVAKDMIACASGRTCAWSSWGRPPISPAIRCRVPQDLVAHNCINMDADLGRAVCLELREGGREVNVRCEGQLVLNNLPMRLSSVLAGLGLAWLPEDQVLPYLADGRLIRVLDDWSPDFPRLSPLLPEPALQLAGADPAGRGAAPPAAVTQAFRPPRLVPISRIARNRDCEMRRDRAERQPLARRLTPGAPTVKVQEMQLARGLAADAIGAPRRCSSRFAACLRSRRASSPRTRRMTAFPRRWR